LQCKLLDTACLGLFCPHHLFLPVFLQRDCKLGFEAIRFVISARDGV
jgi:hypothetical protein